MVCWCFGRCCRSRLQCYHVLAVCWYHLHRTTWWLGLKFLKATTRAETMECLLNFEGLLMDFRVVIFETSRFYTQGKVKIELIHPPTISIAMLFTNVNMPDFLLFLNVLFASEILQKLSNVWNLIVTFYMFFVFCASESSPNYLPGTGTSSSFFGGRWTIVNYGKDTLSPIMEVENYPLWEWSSWRYTLSHWTMMVGWQKKPS